jgi:hypothetical protein
MDRLGEGAGKLENLSRRRSSHAVPLWRHAFFSEFGYRPFGLLEAVDTHAI